MIEKLRVDSKKIKMRKIRGITLISLVITIVILIILASVAIYLGLTNNGIFTRATQAKETTNKQTATEIINLKITNCQINKYAEEQRMPTLKELSEVLRYDDEIKYVTETSQVASTKYEVGENPSSIFTKLDKYPYEFEINSKLQLASIDGVKIASSENNNASSEWKKYMMNENGYVIGTTEVELPENFVEVYIKVTFNNLECVYNYNIPRISLGEKQERVFTGFGASSWSNNCEININKDSVKLNSVSYCSNDYTSSSKLEIFYK